MHRSLGAFAVVCIAGAASAQQTLRVPADFPTIQAALDAAQTDDTIELAPGTYRELTLLPTAIDRLTIRGDGADTTTWSADIDADGAGDGSQLVTTPGGPAPGITVVGITFADANGAGGAIDIATEFDSVFEECVFVRNDSAASGSAIRYQGRSRLTVRRCSFVHNRAGDSAAVSALNYGVTVEACSFLGNRALGFSGAISYQSWNTLVASPLRVTGSLFVGNVGDRVGAISVGEDSELVGNTFAANAPALDIPDTYSSVFAAFGIDVLGRLSGGPLVGSNNIVLLSETVEGFFAVSPPVWESFIGASPIPGGSTFLDPLFVRAPSDGGDGWGDDPATPGIDESLNDDFGDLRLRPGSPAIDAGTNDLYTPGDVDLDGNPRLADDPGIPGANVDIGAYEFQGATCLPDVNQDGFLMPSDFNAWILAYNNGSPLADQNRDGLVMPSDFNAWILNFNLGCP